MHKSKLSNHCTVQIKLQSPNSNFLPKVQNTVTRLPKLSTRYQDIKDIKVSKGTKCSTKSGGKGTNMQRKINMQAT